MKSVGTTRDSAPSRAYSPDALKQMALSRSAGRLGSSTRLVTND